MRPTASSTTAGATARRPRNLAAGAQPPSERVGAAGRGLHHTLRADAEPLAPRRYVAVDARHTSIVHRREVHVVVGVGLGPPPPPLPATPPSGAPPSAALMAELAASREILRASSRPTFSPSRPPVRAHGHPDVEGQVLEVVHRALVVLGVVPSRGLDLDLHPVDVLRSDRARRDHPEQLPLTLPSPASAAASAGI